MLIYQQEECGAHLRGIFLTCTYRQRYATVCNIRTRLSMDIIRSVLVAVRGVLGKAKTAWITPTSNVSFNLIPEEKSYEG